MIENTPTTGAQLFAGAVIWLLILGVACYISSCSTTNNIRASAIKAGVGSYTANPTTGQPEFQWNTPTNR